MAEFRKALVSRHVILPHVLRPVYALILIDNETISEILQLSDTVSVRSVLEEYASWNPQDCEDLYISPGVVDINVRANSAWESEEERTKAAVAGGVTLMLQEPSIFGMQENEGTLYCDVGRVALLGTGPIVATSYFALKAYLYPPSAYVTGHSSALRSTLETARDSNLPLFLDASLPTPRMLHIGSPLHSKPLQDRFQEIDSDETQGFAASFVDIDESNSSDDDSGTDDLMGKEMRHRRLVSVDASKHPFNLSETFTGENPSHRRLSSAFLKPTSETEHPHSAHHNSIYTDLDRRIRKLHESISNLSALEIDTYEYKEPLRKRSQSMQLPDSGSTTPPQSPIMSPQIRPQQMNSKFQERCQLVRPTLLTVNRRQSPGNKEKERSYMVHLANSPGSWETRGVEQQTPCKVHIANLSSAEAVNRVRVYKETSTLLTCETCPHYLYFAAEEIQPGDTRLKAFPPIREKGNRELLTELLLVKAIDVIASSHSAIERDLKFQDLGSFKRAVAGVRCVGSSLTVVWTCIMQKFASHLDPYLTRLSKWLSLAPARILNISHLRGSIEKGKYADLVVWSPFTASHACTNRLNPYSDQRLTGSIRTVYIRGKIAFDRGIFAAVGRREVREQYQ